MPGIRLEQKAIEKLESDRYYYDNMAGFSIVVYKFKKEDLGSLSKYMLSNPYIDEPDMEVQISIYKNKKTAFI